MILMNSRLNFATRSSFTPANSGARDLVAGVLRTHVSSHNISTCFQVSYTFPSDLPKKNTRSHKATHRQHMEARRSLK